MKNRTKLPNIYIGVVTAVLYLPIVLVIIYSFNESKISSVWGGFSLKWYETLFRDAAMFEALGNSIVLALCASLGAAVIGTLGAYGFTKVQLRTKSAVEYVSMLPIMIPEIILGMVFMTFFALICLIPFVFGLVQVLREFPSHRSMVWLKRGFRAFLNGFLNALFYVVIILWFVSCTSGLYYRPMYFW